MAILCGAFVYSPVLAAGLLAPDFAVLLDAARETVDARPLARWTLRASMFLYAPCRREGM